MLLMAEMGTHSGSGSGKWEVGSAALGRLPRLQLPTPHPLPPPGFPTPDSQNSPAAYTDSTILFTTTSTCVFVDQFGIYGVHLFGLGADDVEDVDQQSALRHLCIVFSTPILDRWCLPRRGCRRCR